MCASQNLLLLLYMVVGSLTRSEGLVNVFGYEGSSVRISCSYPQGYENYNKYLCKNDCGDSDVLITTSEMSKKRYQIQDIKATNSFVVTITPLSSLDAGKYWCGVERAGTDIYIEVKLKVAQDICCANKEKIQSHEHGSVSVSCSYESKDQNQLKYICKGNRPSTCLQQAAITSENSSNKRFHLTDDKMLSRFTVVISSLSRSDAGSYLCGVQRDSGEDVFSAVELEVREWCCIKPITMTGLVGQAVTLQCPYPRLHRDNRKFLCKGDHRYNCTDMVTTRSRFTLQDNLSASSFVVAINDLQADDAGTYWCGSDRQWKPANYIKIELSVEFLQQTSTIIIPLSAETVIGNSTGITDKPFKGVALVAVFCGLAVLLILILTLVAAFKCRCFKRREAEVSVTNCVNKTKNNVRNKPKAAEPEDFYSNQAVVMKMKLTASKQQSDAHLYDDAGEDQPDYENFVIPDDIYCNQGFHDTR